MSYAGFNEKIKLIVSPPVIVTPEEILKITTSLSEVIGENPVILISKFIKNYLAN